MNNDNPSNGSPLDSNIGKLLSRTPPTLAMPDAARKRILARLLEEPVTSPPAILRHARRRWRVVLASAAVLVAAFLLVTFWPGHSSGGAVWADVVRNLSQVRTMSGLVESEQVSPDGNRQTRFSRIYYKDPGMSRTEVLGGPGAEPESVLVMLRTPRESVEIRLDLRKRTVHRTTLRFAGSAVEERTQAALNLAEESWRRLGRITSDQARKIGSRVIDGIRATGFEAPVGLLFDDPSAPHPEGTIRVWASDRTASPVLLEGELRDPRGGANTVRIRQLAWNAPVADDLFRPAAPAGWQVEEKVVEIMGFAGKTLKDGILFRVGPRDGEAVVTERDIEAVIEGRSERAGSASGPSRAHVGLLLTEEGGRRLAEFTRAHPGEQVLVDFNGEVRYEVRIGGVMQRRVLLDITALGKHLERFERDYLR